MKQHLFLVFMLTVAIIGGSTNATAQEKEDNLVYDTFLSTRIVNAQSIEMIPKRNLDIRITHKFEDIAGPTGGANTFWGFDNVADVRIALEYGITDDLAIGFGRSKGYIGPTKLLDGFVKYRIFQQTRDNKMPISLGVYANTVYSAAQADEVDPTSELFFDGNFTRRLSYNFQIMIARKFGERFSLQIMPNYLHRNFVRANDENNLFSMGVGARLAVSKNVAFLLEYYQYFSEFRADLANLEGDVPRFYPPIGVGIEIKTGGHVFTLNLTNSPGIIENQFIPYTNKSWLDGQFRFGFNISRMVKL